MKRALLLICALLAFAAPAHPQTARASDNGLAIAGDNNTVGITLEEYERKLKAATAELSAEVDALRDELRDADVAEGVAKGRADELRDQLAAKERSLAGAQNKLADVESAYAELLERLTQMEADLEAARAESPGRIPADLFDEAKAAIQSGELEKAEALVVPLLEPQPFADLLAEQARLYTIAGEAAEARFDYAQASSRHIRAAQFVPDEARYARKRIE